LGGHLVLELAALVDDDAKVMVGGWMEDGEGGRGGGRGTPAGDNRARNAASTAKSLLGTNKNVAADKE
jgi:hypothetical protein